MGIIKVNRKEVDVRESLHANPMSQPGHALTHAKTVKEQFNLIGAGRKNLLINGDFQIWQRGTTISIPSSGYGQYGPDRWGQYYANGGATVERQSVTVDGKLTYAARCNTDADGRIYFHQHIENGSKLLSDKDYTLSFWARCNAGMQGKLEVERYFFNLDGSGGYGYQSLTEEYVEPEWKYFEFHFRDIDNTQTSHDRYFQLAIATETYVPRPDWIEFAFVQLELGKVATPFEQRSYGEELALCQRYYIRYTNTYADQEQICVGVIADADDVFGVVHLPVEMRGEPAVATSGSSDFEITTVFGGGGGTQTASVALGYASNRTPGIRATGQSGGLSSGARIIRFKGAPRTKWLAFDAELR
jgi:hypothetical protein